MEKIGLKLTDPRALDGNFIKMIGKEWMLITAGTPDKFNTMTASWGGVGELWNFPVAFAFVRPQRYTFEFTESNEYFTLSFFGSGYRKELAVCGSVSGRDMDKVAETGLVPVATPQSVAFEQAVLVLECRKLYADFLSKDAFIDKSIPGDKYPDNDFHKMYVGEITAAWQRE